MVLVPCLSSLNPQSSSLWLTKSCHIQEMAGSWTKQCLCAPGWSGPSCSNSTHATIPKLSGLVHLTPPTLQNANSDLHLSLDFKPQSWTGLLLLTGETDDMTGDYLALLLKDGFVELRLECGSGPGKMVSSTQVHLHQWNHLSVFRHDWGSGYSSMGGKERRGDHRDCSQG